MLAKPQIFSSHKLLIAVIILLQSLSFSQDENRSKKEVEEVVNEKKSILKVDRKRFKLNFPESFEEVLKSILAGERKAIESIFRPMEFREPIATIPAEGRFGVGFYGWNGLNFLKIHPRSISYSEDVEEKLQEISFSGRMGSFLEMDAGQTNLSYVFFGKSYVDILTGLGFRYSSIFPFPRMEISDDLVISGPPSIPESWGIDRKFSPSVLEMNLVSSYIMQWHPKWFFHLKYSYGLNYARFYKDESLDSSPYGTGTSSSYSLGLKIISESPTEARYAWGVELRHIFHNVKTIQDPLELTPIKGMKLPNLGIFFTFSAFYGGQKTAGDVGKKLFLDKNYVEAKSQFLEFINSHPKHARIPRAKKLLEIINKRIPYQLYNEGENFQKINKMDYAAEKYVEAMKTAQDTLKDQLENKIDDLVKYYVEEGTIFFEKKQYDKSLEFLSKAATLSDNGKRAQKNLKAKILLQQGNKLVSAGLFSMAIRKYDEIPALDSSMEISAKRASMEAAVRMVGDFNRAKDIKSLRLALKSLKLAKEIFQPADFKYENYITLLEQQLLANDSLLIRNKMNESLMESRKVLSERHLPKVETGMLGSEVEEIIGIPDEIIKESKDNGKTYEMWIYYLPNNKKRLLYFEEYILFKLETG
tara:strand:+ start:15764 stop:17695 length:1932 start_codon:yes stop_codon:yes gene_type:complete